jgi:hypothetical protein
MVRSAEESTESITLYVDALWTKMHSNSHIVQFDLLKLTCTLFCVARRQLRSLHRVPPAKSIYCEGSKISRIISKLIGECLGLLDFGVA